MGRRNHLVSGSRAAAFLHVDGHIAPRRKGIEQATIIVERPESMTTCVWLCALPKRTTRTRTPTWSSHQHSRHYRYCDGRSTHDARTGQIWSPAARASDEIARSARRPGRFCCLRVRCIRSRLDLPTSRAVRAISSENPAREAISSTPGSHLPASRAMHAIPSDRGA